MSCWGARGRGDIDVAVGQGVGCHGQAESDVEREGSRSGLCRLGGVGDLDDESRRGRSQGDAREGAVRFQGEATR